MLTNASTRRLATASNAWVASRMFVVLSLEWDGLIPPLLLMTSCLGRGDISTVTMIISPLLQNTMSNPVQYVKPSHKPIHTKRLNYYHLIQSPNVDLSLRPYITNLGQINPNLQGYIIKAVIVLTSIPYQILKNLESNIVKIIGIEILYPLHTYNQSYALVDHLLTPNRSVPIVR
jgi:hypothetical protein